MKEYLDVINSETGEVTGEIIERSVAHKKGIWHRTSHVWIMNKNKSLLLQKRSNNKSSFPGCFDISSAGHIPAGVDYEDSAIRELKEELGLEIKKDELNLVGTRIVIWDEEFFGKEFHDRQYSNVYIIFKDLDINNLILQTLEVDSVKWIGIDECIDSVKNNKFKNCIALEELEMLKNYINR